VGRLGDARDRNHRRVYISAYGAGYPYYGYGPWIVPGFPTVLDYDDSDYSNDQNYGPPYVDNGGDNGPPYGDNGDGYQEQPPPQWPALGPYAPSASAQPSPQAAGQGITVIFKDGRPPELIHNYMLTRTTLFVGDESGKTIPLNQIDIAATERANRDAGVDFKLPETLNN
jgi:hypothetical protein